MPNTRRKNNISQKVITNDTSRNMKTNDKFNKALRHTIGQLTQKISRLEDQLKKLEQNDTHPLEPRLVDRMGEEPMINASESNSENVRNSTEEVNQNTTQGHDTSTEKICYINVSQISNVERPRFPGKMNIHPVTFIEDLSSWLKRSPNKNTDIDLIIECLEGHSRDWARIYKRRWTTLTEFKRDFLNTYWGEAEQSELRKKIVCNKWNKELQSSMLDHFITLSGQAKMLNNPIPEGQLIDDIMSHFPKDVQYAWSNQTGNLLEAAEFLRKLDAVNRKTEQFGTQVRSSWPKRDQKNRFTPYNKSGSSQGFGNAKKNNHRGIENRVEFSNINAVNEIRDNTENGIAGEENKSNKIIDLN